ncbi:MAG: hypothetical protein WCB78_10170, partial [Pseudolabrys sp.]
MRGSSPRMTWESISTTSHSGTALQDRNPDGVSHNDPVMPTLVAGMTVRQIRVRALSAPENDNP